MCKIAVYARGFMTSLMITMNVGKRGTRRQREQKTRDGNIALDGEMNDPGSDVSDLDVDDNLCNDTNRKCSPVSLHPLRIE